MLSEYKNMEVESPIHNNHKMINETIIYDILAHDKYCLHEYKKQGKQNEMHLINNINSKKPMININTIDLYTQNSKIEHVKVPVNLMPPPPHSIVNNNNIMKSYDRRDNTKLIDNYRTSSPKGYDSDESCSSYSSRSMIHQNTGIKCNNSRNGLDQYNNHQGMAKKYNQNSQNMYHSNPHPHNRNYNKNRFQTNNNSNITNNNNNNSGRQKLNYNGNSSDMMVRRAHGLAERFKTRSELMKINPNPPGLLNGSLWDNLNQSIWDVFSSKAQKEITYERKINLWKTIFLYIRNCLHSYGLFMVGSTMSGFGLESSDIDMCILTKTFTSDPRLDSLHHLNNVRHLLMECGLTTEAELIFAKVPILKFRDAETGFEIDLNCNNAVGIRNTHLLHCYSRLDWRVRPLVVMIKLWAQANNINDAKNMTISSYSWALMVIHYLQCGVTPPVLPCLHGLVPEVFNSDSESHSMDVQEEIGSIMNFKSDNTNCLGELLLGFLHYYSVFNYMQYAISVRAGCRLPIDECRFTKAPKNDPHQWKCLCIEEPFDFTNTARSVFDMEVFKNIKQIIVTSYKELERTKMLSSILPVNICQR